MNQNQATVKRTNAIRCYQFNRNSHTLTLSNKTKSEWNQKIEQLEKEDPTGETLASTNRWKELVKPNNYKMTHGVWKKYNPHDFTE